MCPRMMVCWSSARATSAIAMLPEAPGLLSTNTLWPSVLPSSAAADRATISELPPGANGTTKRTGLDGQACAKAWDGSRPAAAEAPAAPRKVRLVWFMVSLQAGDPAAGAHGSWRGFQFAFSARPRFWRKRQPAWPSRREGARRHVQQNGWRACCGSGGFYGSQRPHDPPRLRSGKGTSRVTFRLSMETRVRNRRTLLFWKKSCRLSAVYSLMSRTTKIRMKSHSPVT